MLKFSKLPFLTKDASFCSRWRLLRRPTIVQNVEIKRLWDAQPLHLRFSGRVSTGALRAARAAACCVTEPSRHGGDAAP